MICRYVIIAAIEGKLIILALYKLILQNNANPGFTAVPQVNKKGI